ncbi:MAG: 2-succinyl-5-enolpyruvyl-6-hydroxy-3-cyclohexene-1-carboxylic-acid synthase [Phormidesmis sp.]
MPIDFRNTNSLWASVAVETLARLGLQTAVVCPGSRSTPLTFALAQHSAIEALPILDERSAAFFALGCAKRQHRPVVLVCTSGTAGANFYPAVIEAYESGIPLLIFTADRPPEMRECASGQTIDQQKLYGSFVRQYSELAIPTVDEAILSYLRQTLVNAWGRAISAQAGPIHFNCPFRDPLPPLPDLDSNDNGDTLRSLSTTFDSDRFFAAVTPPMPSQEQTPYLSLSPWRQCSEGVIIAGAAMPENPQDYCKAVNDLAEALSWPVLAEGLSPLRNYSRLNASLISTYDIILRNSERASALVPQQVVQLGPLPISKVLRQWLQQVRPQRWIIGSQQNLDPLHGPTHFLSTDIEAIAWLATNKPINESLNPYTQRWLAYEETIRNNLYSRLIAESDLVESKVVWLLSQHLPAHTPLYIANSMPVRDVEYFWGVGDRAIQPVFSRGANGIDGTLSTAMGLAHHNRPTVLLTGDLAFLHDTNGLLNTPQLQGHLTVVLINNNGGGIFEMLPVSQFEPEFEKYFVTPQQVEFAHLCQTYGVQHQRVTNTEDFVEKIRILPEGGMRVLEIICDDKASAKENRKQSAQQRKKLLSSL